jgi:hypothetical protein
MRSALEGVRSVLAPIVIAVTLAAAASGPAEDWAPFYAFMGTWTGTRTGASGVVRVTRDYESIDGRQQLLVSEGPASNRSPWGLVSFDPIRRGFVLRRLGADVGFSELVLSQVSGSGATLVFDTESGGSSTDMRITDERHGQDEFVERVETRSKGALFTLVSETQFRRRH